MDTLVFKNIKLNPIQRNDGQVWITSSDLAKLLDYKQENSVSKIYNRNADEFTEKMTQIISNFRIPNLGIRVFSLRGCHLVAMFARTPVAKDFRKWVLDILDSRVQYEISIEREQNYVRKSDHELLALRYHAMFQKYERVIGNLRNDIHRMSDKCHELDMIIEKTSMTISEAAHKLGIKSVQLEYALYNLGWLNKNTPTIHGAPIYLTLSEQADRLDWLRIRGIVENNVVNEVVKITQDGLLAIESRLRQQPDLMDRI